MNTFTVSFFGHRQITCPETIETALEHLICELLKHRPYVDFLVGRSGDEEITMEQIAAAADSFNYEFVCGISRRVPRIYSRGGKTVHSVHYLLDTQA